MSTESRYFVYADLNCPLCFALHERLAQLGLHDQVNWRVVEHDNHACSTNLSFKRLSRTARDVAAVRVVAPEVKIAVPTVRPNTGHLNRLIVDVMRHSPAKAQRLRTALYRALWWDGDDISDAKVIRRHLDALGLSPTLSASVKTEADISSWREHWQQVPFERRAISIGRFDGRALTSFPTLADLRMFFADVLSEQPPGHDEATEARPRQKIVVACPTLPDAEKIVLATRHYDFELFDTLEGAKACITQNAELDLLVLDSDVGWSNTLAYCRELKLVEKTRRIPVLVLCGQSDVQSELDAFDAGVVDVVRKPFDPRALAARIATQLRSKRSGDVLEQLATIDGLTDVPNRRWFDHSLEVEWLRARRAKQSIALLMIDIDCFKQFNDAYGHPKGDQCLIQVAHRLVEASRRPKDVIARYGGEEFAVILPDTDERGALHMAQRYVEAIRDLGVEHRFSTVSECVTISVGGRACAPGVNTSPLELLNAADANLLVAKRQGRNRAVVEGVAHGSNATERNSKTVRSVGSKSRSVATLPVSPMDGLSVSEREKFLDLLGQISATANEASELEGAISTCLDLVCDFVGWPVGHAYLVDESLTNQLNTTQLWHFDEAEKFSEFREITERTNFRSGVGLPGRVLQSGSATWISDVTQDDNFPRANNAGDLGIHAAFAFPITVAKRVTGVLEFFSLHVEEPNPVVLELMSHIGLQLGRVAERQLVAQQLQTSERRFRDFAALAADFFWETDASLHFTYVSAALETMLSADDGNFLGKRMFDVWPEVGRFLRNRTAGDRPPVDESCWIDGPRRRCIHVVGHRKEDDQGGFAGYRGCGTDVTETHELSEELLYQSTHDPVTDLANRRVLAEKLEHAVKRMRVQGLAHALCHIDLDGFKIVNDGGGHVAGDAFLQQVAVLLTGRVRGSDTVARIGPDEFGVLFENCALEQACSVADELRRALASLNFVWGGRTYTLTCTVGVIPVTLDDTENVDFMAAAESACAAAREIGPNRVHVVRIREDAQQQWRGQAAWIPVIQDALEQERLRLFRQPIAELAADDEAPKHFELLLRLCNEAGELIGPFEMMNAAERYNLATRIDRWVTSTALSWLSRQPEVLQGELYYNINLSSQSLVDHDFLDTLVATIEGVEGLGSQVCFEITETAAISNVHDAMRFIRTLQARGCRFALDDFGSGVCSFGYLRKIPVDYLKIDGQFVRNIANDAQDYAMVRSINEIGQLMGKKTVAEFVEDAEILERLRHIGVDFAQGYFIGKPEPIAGEYLSAPPVLRDTG